MVPGERSSEYRCQVTNGTFPNWVSLPTMCRCRFAPFLDVKLLVLLYLRGFSVTHSTNAEHVDYFVSGPTMLSMLPDRIISRILE